MTSYSACIHYKSLLLNTSVMPQKQVKPLQASSTYRPYSPTAMRNAFQACMERKMPVKTAARQYGVPRTTLRDRVTGRIGPDTLKSGRSSLFTLEEESAFVNHIIEMAELGYVYSRSEVIEQASNYAIFLKKRDSNLHLSDKWYIGFMRRWPDIKFIKTNALSHYRTATTTRNNITMYFQNLKTVLNKQDTNEKPGCIYNLDETEQTLSYVCASDSAPDEILPPHNETQNTNFAVTKRSKIANTIQSKKKLKSSHYTPPHSSLQTAPSELQGKPVYKSDIANSDYVDDNEMCCVCNLCANNSAIDNILSRLNEAKSTTSDVTKRSKLENTIQLMKKPKSCDFTKPYPTPQADLQVLTTNYSETTNLDNISDDEICCVCNRFQPVELQDCVSVVFTKWAQCDIPSCKHWTHLKYCCAQTVVRRNTEFVCPCHGNDQEK